jgi:hypothetical protein
MFLGNRIPSNRPTEARDSSLKESRRPGAPARPTRAARVNDCHPRPVNAHPKDFLSGTGAIWQ